MRGGGQRSEAVDGLPELGRLVREQGAPARRRVVGGARACISGDPQCMAAFEALHDEGVRGAGQGQVHRFPSFSAQSRMR